MNDDTPRRPLRDQELQQFADIVAAATRDGLTNAQFQVHPQVVSAAAQRGEGHQYVHGAVVRVHCRRNPGAVCPDGKAYRYEPGWLDSFRNDLADHQFLAP